MAQDCVRETSRAKLTPVQLEHGEILWSSHGGVLSYNDLGVEKLEFTYDGEPLTGVVRSIFKVDTHVLYHFVDHGILHVTPNTQHLLKQADHPGTAPSTNECGGIWQTGDTVLITCQTGVSFYHLSTRTIIHHIAPATAANVPENPKKTSNLILDIHQDRLHPDVLWLSGASGLFRMKLPNYEITYIDFDLKLMSDKNLDNPGYRSMLLGEMLQIDATLYFPSWGGGIITYDTEYSTWNINKYDERIDINPMAFNVTSKLKQWNDSLILFTSLDRAPGFFNIHTKTYIDNAYTRQINLRNEPSKGIHRHGNSFYIGYRHAICRYDGNEYFPQDSIAPSIKLASMKSVDQFVTKNNGFKTTIPAPLSTFQRTIDLVINTFQTRDLKNPVLACRLQGMEDSWRTMPTSGKITYTNLKGGSYTFQARITDQNGIEIYSPKYPFFIAKYFWEKAWFYILICTAIILIGTPLIFYIRRIQRERKKVALQYQIELSDTRLTALRAQMNPHFLFNSLSAINHHIIQSDPRTASRYLTKFAHLMRRILNNSQEGFITLNNELTTLKMYVDLEDFRYDHTIQYTQDIDPTIDQDDLHVPSMLLQPYIENAIRHGIMNKNGPGHIQLSIWQGDDKDTIDIIITDDGIGRTAARALKDKKVVKNKSMGLEITKNRIQLLSDRFGLTLNVQTDDIISPAGNITGTRVHITIPFITREYVHTLA